MDTGIYRYQIGPDDRITWVNAAWRTFASANDGAALAHDHVLGQSLWDYVTDAEVERLYRAIVRASRLTQRGAGLPFRCDSPTARRYMTLEIMPIGPDALVFESYLISEEPRPYVALWDARRRRTARRVTACSWCKRVELHGSGGGWVEVEEALARRPELAEEPLPTLDHAVCPGCRAAAEDVARLLRG